MKDERPAFPIHPMIAKKFAPGADAAGMTLRDYFAGQAIIALCPNADLDRLSRAAADAYRIADAMMAAREK